ncbi:hypothetical protein FGO68_gene2038 [Halteria grandinella]|uniref:Uncharacterized protein n=1 Tax=Halteria grandinella TaxID=5974 RepID=A0A8J8NM45_HALGN|nr:hypothetical protein FGO68_gene2038 [Halteria grandinella]
MKNTALNSESKYKVQIQMSVFNWYGAITDRLYIWGISSPTVGIQNNGAVNISAALALNQITDFSRSINHWTVHRGMTTNGKGNNLKIERQNEIDFHVQMLGYESIINLKSVTVLIPIQIKAIVNQKIKAISMAGLISGQSKMSLSLQNILKIFKPSQLNPIRNNGTIAPSIRTPAKISSLYYLQN